MCFTLWSMILVENSKWQKNDLRWVFTERVTYIKLKKLFKNVMIVHNIIVSETSFKIFQTSYGPQTFFKQRVEYLHTEHTILFAYYFR